MDSAWYIAARRYTAMVSLIRLCSSAPPIWASFGLRLLPACSKQWCRHPATHTLPPRTIDIMLACLHISTTAAAKLLGPRYRHSATLSPRAVAFLFFCQVLDYFFLFCKTVLWLCKVCPIRVYRSETLMYCNDEKLLGFTADSIMLKFLTVS